MIDEFDKKVLSNPDGGNFFQSAELAQIKQQNGWVARQLIVGDIAVSVHERKLPLLGRLWYIPKGPGAVSVNQLAHMFPELRKKAIEAGAFVIKMEPEIVESPKAYSALSKLGLVKVRPIQPNVSTVIIDLSPSVDDIMASFSQRGRRQIRRSERDGVTVQAVDLTPENMRIMYEMTLETAENRFSTRPFSYYKHFWQTFHDSGMGQLFFAFSNKKPIAGEFLVVFGKKAIYKDGASWREKVAHSAGHLVQWTAMQWAKEHGALSYDMHGSPHSAQLENTSHPQYGLGIFKTSFNKHVTDYVGAFDLPIKPFAYKVWTSLGERVTLRVYHATHHQSWY